jgi:hypothetical protein
MAEKKRFGRPREAYILGAIVVTFAMVAATYAYLKKRAETHVTALMRSGVWRIDWYHTNTHFEVPRDETLHLTVVPVVPPMEEEVVITTMRLMAPGIGRPSYLPMPDIQADVDSILERLPKGTVAYNAPEEMALGEQATIQVALSLRLADDLKELIATPGEKLTARVKMDNRIEAHLQGDGFKITSIGSELRPVPGNDVTRWEWEVRPTEPGQQALRLTVSVLPNVDERRPPRMLETFDTDIDVKVAWWQQPILFAGRNWQWLWTTLLVPLVGWGWHRYRPRKSPTT